MTHLHERCVCVGAQQHNVDLPRRHGKGEERVIGYVEIALGVCPQLAEVP